MKIKNRFYQVAKIFLLIAFDLRREYIISGKKGYKYAQIKMKNTHKKRAEDLYELAVRLGGVLIKLCQFLSTRQDILPSVYIETLSRLQDNVPPIAFKELKPAIINEYNGMDFPFTRIEEEPLASASLGQVHKAVLKNGEIVVFKILKPGIERLIDLDSAILYFIFKVLNRFKFFQKNIDFFGLFDEFIKVTGDELNFTRERFIAKQFKKLLKKFDYLRIPYIYEEFCTKKIIVMEYIEGDKITAKDRWINRNNDPVMIAHRVIELYMEQFLSLRLVHYDPHPGNILVLDHNQIALLDFGMSGEITPQMSHGMNECLYGFINKDYELILETLKELGFFKKDAEIDKLYPIITYLFDEIIDTVKLDKESLQSVDFSPILDELVDMIYSQPFKLPYEWAYIGKTIGSIIGLIAFLYPDFKIYDELKPYFEKIAQENFSETFIKMSKKTVNIFTDFVKIPKKALQFIDKVEHGRLKFKFELEELDNRIDNLKSVIVRACSAGMAFISGIISYFLYLYHHITGTIVFGGFAIGFLLFFSLYRNIKSKDIIRKNLFRSQ